jgi:hypothetical protein
MLRRLLAIGSCVVVHYLDALCIVVIFIIAIDISSIDGKTLYRLVWPFPIRPLLSQLFHRAQLIA